MTAVLQGNPHGLCRRFRRRRSQEESRRLQKAVKALRQGLARAWRARLPRMGRRRRQGRQVDLVSARREEEAQRDRGILLDHLQVARRARQGQRQGDGRPAVEGRDGCEQRAVRRQADDLWRLRKPRDCLALGDFNPLARKRLTQRRKRRKIAACIYFVCPYTLQYKVRTRCAISTRPWPIFLRSAASLRPAPRFAATGRRRW